MTNAAPVEDMKTGGLTLWGTGTIRQLRPHWLLMEMGLEYEFVPVHPRSGQTYKPEFLKINPRHKVPVLRHGDLILTESAAILQYLCDAFDAPAEFAIPRDPVSRAQLNEWCFFIMSELDPTLYVIFRHTGLANLYGEAPAAVEAARAYASDQFEAMAPRITRSGAFLLGHKMSVADILMGTILDWMVSNKFALPEDVSVYHRRLIERPAYRAARERVFGTKPARLPKSPSGNFIKDCIAFAA